MTDKEIMDYLQIPSRRWKRWKKKTPKMVSLVLENKPKVQTTLEELQSLGWKKWEIAKILAITPFTVGEKAKRHDRVFELALTVLRET